MRNTNSTQGTCPGIMENRSSSQKFAAALIIAVLATGAVAAFLLLRPTPQPSQTAPDVEQAGGQRSDPATSTPPVASTAPRPASSTSMLFPGVPQNRDAMEPKDDDPFDGRSREEQRWLDEHGYPNTAQWASYSSAPDALLEQAANNGDKLARTMLDSRRLPDRAALDQMMSSAVDGNYFALQLLATHFASTGRAGNINAYAVSRVLEMRADPSAALGREIMFSAPLTIEERMQGEAEALRLNATFNQLYQGRTGNAFVPDYRPFPVDNSQGWQ